jgi:hypothetical protein
MQSVNKNFSILFWNAQGISNKTKQIELEILTANKNIDVFLLSETFLNLEHTFDISNYDIYRADRGSHGGGVAIGVKNTLMHNHIGSFNTKNVENVSIELKINGQNTTITSIYSPKYHTDFENDLEIITPSNRKFIVAGDFNAKHPQWNNDQSNLSGRILANLQHKRNLIIHNTPVATHHPHSGNTPSTIDLLLSNCPHIFNLEALEGQLSSDHTPILCTINEWVDSCEPKKVYKYKSTNWIDYQTEILKNLPPPYTCTTKSQIDEEVAKFQAIIVNARNKATPVIEIKKPHRKDISNEAKEAIKIRNLLKRQWQRCRAPAEKSLLKSL